VAAAALAVLEAVADVAAVDVAVVVAVAAAGTRAH